MAGTKKQPEKPVGTLSKDISFGGISFAEKAVFAKNLSVMIKSGLVITEALEIIVASTRGRFKRVLKGVLKSVGSGQTLSSSFARYPKIFSGLFISATQAGEASGTLDETLDNVAEQMEKEKELSSKIKGAMLYPAVILVAALILGLAVSFLVLPQITPLFSGLKMELPFTTRVLINFSNAVSAYGIWLFSGIILSIGFLVWLVKQKFSRPVIHLLLLRIPVIKRISRNSNLARFCLNLGTLLKSGLNIDEALDISSQAMGNYYYKKAVVRTSHRISKGGQLSDSLEKYNNLFPIMATRMISVGEQSGKLEETLLYLANFYEAEVDNATKTLSTAIEPILLSIIGLVVGFLALSIITPIYNITGGVRR
jgi:type IV pilus assembly protein PilC